jgi:hypothetical protein
MSQSATLYRISNDTFRQLEASVDRPQFEISSAKNYTTFQGSFMGLEYILSKGQDIPTTKIINEILDLPFVHYQYINYFWLRNTSSKQKKIYGKYFL